MGTVALAAWRHPLSPHPAVHCTCLQRARWAWVTLWRGVAVGSLCPCRTQPQRRKAQALGGWWDGKRRRTPCSWWLVVGLSRVGQASIPLSTTRRHPAARYQCLPCPSFPRDTLALGAAEGVPVTPRVGQELVGMTPTTTLATTPWGWRLGWGPACRRCRLGAPNTTRPRPPGRHPCPGRLVVARGRKARSAPGSCRPPWPQQAQPPWANPWPRCRPGCNGLKPGCRMAARQGPCTRPPLTP